MISKKDEKIFFLKKLAKQLTEEICNLVSELEIAAEEIREILADIISSKKEQLKFALSHLAIITKNDTKLNRMAVTQ